MKKKIVLFACEGEALKNYADRLQTFFGGRIEIYPYVVPDTIGDYTFPDIPEGDLYVASMPDVIPSGKSFLNENVPVVYISRTFLKRKTRPLTLIPAGSTVLFADYSNVIGTETLGILNSINKNLNFIYCDTEEELSRHSDAFCVVTVRGDYPAPPWDRDVVNIGWYEITPTTYMEIAQQLNILNAEISEKIYRYSQTVHMVNPGIFEVIKGTWELEDVWNTVLDMINEGIILLNETGELLRYNLFAQRQGVILDREGGGKRIHPGLQALVGVKCALTNEVAELGNPSRTLLVSSRLIVTYGEMKGSLILLQDAHDVQQAETRLRLQQNRKKFTARYTFADIVTCSPCVKKVIEISRKIAKTDLSILITGDSGAGKELFAQSIHNESERRDMPFVAINCAAIPAQLLESELFGYEEGAFTGAKKGGKRGLLELAHKGSIFFDEIGDMPMPVQAKILRVLQEREVMRIGGETLIPINVRVMAASNVDFEELVSEKKFRKDLFYRLNAVQIEIPSLAERREDIPLLAAHFLRQMGGQQLSAELIAYMERLPWNGNVRELRNCVEYMHAMGGVTLDLEDLPVSQKKMGENLPKQEDVERELSFLLDEERVVAEEILAVLRVRNVGRRQLKKILENREIFISEYRLRKLLELMNGQGMIHIQTGRRGIALK